MELLASILPKGRKKVLGTRSWKLTPNDRGQNSRREPSHCYPSRPVTGRKDNGRSQPELRKRSKGWAVDLRLSEAQSRRGQSPGRHTHPWAPLVSQGRFCPAPRASRELLPRPSGRSTKPAARSCPLPRVSSLRHSSSHLPATQEEQDASSRCGATSGEVLSIASRDAAAAGYWETGKGAGLQGQGAGSDFTGGGGPGKRAAEPRLPDNPSGVLISGLGVSRRGALCRRWYS